MATRSVAAAALLYLLLAATAAAAPFDLGHMIITQNALRDAPERYASQILNAIVQAAQAYKVGRGWGSDLAWRE